MDVNQQQYYGNPQIGYGNGYPIYQQPMYGQPEYFGSTAYQYGQQPQFNTQNALSEEEIQELLNARPSEKFSLNIDPLEALRCKCTHKHNGEKTIYQLNDGSGDVYCKICGERWNSTPMSKEDIKSLIDKLIEQMQNDKLYCDFSPQVTGDYYIIIAMLRKYPDMHDYILQKLNRSMNASGYYNANEQNFYNNYNSMFHGGYNQPVMGQPYQPMQQGYYGQPAPAAGYQPQGQMANPNYNPMQSPYGVNPAAPNQQFNAQAQQMMPGTVYQAPQQQGYFGQPYAPQPVYGTPQVQPQQQPAQQVGQQTTTPNGSVVTNNSDGTTTSETKIDL